MNPYQLTLNFEPSPPTHRSVTTFRRRKGRPITGKQCSDQPENTGRQWVMVRRSLSNVWRLVCIHRFKSCVKQDEFRAHLCMPHRDSDILQLLLLRDLLECLPDAMVVLNQAGEIVQINFQTENLFGYSREELLGHSLEHLFPAGFAGLHLGSRPIAGLELYARRKDGGEFPVEVRLNPIKPEGVLVAAAIRDITTRKSAEKKFEALLESVAEALVILDRSGAVVLANSQTQSLFGFSGQDLLGKNSAELIPERYRSSYRQQRQQLFADAGARPVGLDLELYGLRKDGTEFPVEISLSPLFAAGDRYLTATLRDISDRKRAQAEISRLNVELEARISELAESNQDREALSHSVSHDLRAPLRQIERFAKILVDQPSSLTPAQRECVEHIRQATSQMAQLLAEILDFARVAQQPLNREDVDLQLLVEEVASSLQPEIPGREVSWCIGPLSHASCDRAQIRLVFQHLLSNAVKFTRTRDHAVIEVGETRSTGERVLFTRDNGVGFHVKPADTLFGILQRLPIHQEFEGAGLGLAVVHRIVAKHGGRIWARSEAGAGTTFFFTISPERSPRLE